MKEIFDTLSKQHSRSVTAAYSTSFSSGVSLLHPSLRDPIHAIYGFVRLADEIVDSFHDYDRQKLLTKFIDDTWEAIENGISLNPILNSFQWVVNRYQIHHRHIQLFMESMAMDLNKVEYDQQKLDDYVVGSAEVVGLMCLTVFCEGDAALFDRLEPHAKSLGSAFQKINFLRDMRQDVEELGRHYFPNTSTVDFDDMLKRKIEEEIKMELDHAVIGIAQLPSKSRRGVYTAYVYYNGLLKRIMRVDAKRLFESRIRVSNLDKLTLLMGTQTKFSLGLI